jgi:hypothetical protein
LFKEAGRHRFAVGPDGSGPRSFTFPDVQQDKLAIGRMMGAVKSFAKGTAGGASLEFAIGAAVAAASAWLIYKQNQEDFDAAANEVWNRLSAWTTPENIAGLTAFTVAGMTATVLFGPVGAVSMLVLAAPEAYDKITGLISGYRQQYEGDPDWSFIVQLDDFVKGTEREIEKASFVLANFPTLLAAYIMREVVFATGSTVAQGTDGVDYMVHTGFGGLESGAGNDFVVAYSSTKDAPAGSQPQLEILAGDGDDFIIAVNRLEPGDGQTLGQEMRELYIDAGTGNDWVLGLGAAEIFMGAGDDWLIHAGNGSVVHGGTGKDTFWYTDGVMVADATGEDRLSYYGIGLGLALAWGGAESQWATFVNMPLAWAGFNADGDLVVQDFISLIRSKWDTPANSALYNMYFANGNRDPLAPPEARTAGVQVAAVEFDAVKLMDLQAGAFKGLFQLLELLAGNLRDTLKANGLALAGDPLVLDLDGDGLELMARGSVSPLFDVDGDMFAEATGWVIRDDGLLAVDGNGNGQIDDVSELFGSQTASGFIELAAYDSNADGKVDASDAKFADLRVWQDKDGDAIADAGELLTLSEAKIVSIATKATDTSYFNALNKVAAEGSFTRADGTTSGIYDVRFLTNEFKSRYIGDTSVTAAVAATRPNLKGHGTLTDLQVAARRHAVRQPERWAA